MPESSKDECPVDHKSREAWMSQARAAAAAAESQTLPHSMPTSNTNAQESCPVDHKAREVWLKQQQHQQESQPSAASILPQPQPTRSWSSYMPSFWSSSTRPTPSSTKTAASSSLSTDRVISSIPRTEITGDSAGPANQEQETGADKTSGNWIYPSEKMFFEAMKRKGHDARSTDMRTVVPIHNAVNERAWAEIKEWEAPYVKGTSCDGPRLHSFSGLSTKMTPKARLNTLLGYQAPFDRHDWVVDRCGKEVEYVIDFYAGRNTGGGPKLSFYLDVRPKLNTWEGIKMRVLRGIGIV